MTYQMLYTHRLAALLLSIGIMLLLILLVVVPVQAQNPVPDPATRPELNQVQEAPRALLLFLAVQFVLLVIFMVSYLVDPKRLRRANELHLSHRWYGFLHLPH